MSNFGKGSGRGPSNRLGGYTAAASFLASDPDNETLVFRKFDELSALNLLYMQSEILELKERFRQVHNATTDSFDMNLKDMASTWETLRDQSQPGKAFKEEAKERMDMIIELRSKLREYHKALLLQREISNLKQPEPRVVEALRYFFTYPHHILGGKAKTIFDETFVNDQDDLVALGASKETDLLSNFLRRHWRDEEEIASDGISSFRRFKEASIARAVNIVTVIVAAVFLIGTMVGFYFVQKTEVKLGMIAAFTSAFAGSLGLITNARRVEIFAATAAYAAVLVVFVSNSDLSSGSS